MNRGLWCLIVMFVAAASVSNAEPQKQECQVPPLPRPDFGRLKQLVGKWEGVQKNEVNGKTETIAVSYHLTSGGSALVETLFPGTPHEMVSVYHADGDELMMTHYCMLGNQPNLRQEKADAANQMKFDFDGGTGIKSSKDPHMHALTITFLDKNHFRQEWVFFDAGKQKSVKTLDFERKK